MPVAYKQKHIDSVDDSLVAESQGCWLVSGVSGPECTELCADRDQCRLPITYGDHNVDLREIFDRT
jgi:hypothetical protein